MRQLRSLESRSALSSSSRTCRPTIVSQCISKLPCTRCRSKKRLSKFKTRIVSQFLKKNATLMKKIALTETRLSKKSKKRERPFCQKSLRSWRRENVPPQPFRSSKPRNNRSSLQKDYSMFSSSKSKYLDFLPKRLLGNLSNRK